ncbi:MAG: P-loop NTPase [Clostridia bacterium]|nr:P-loop NTPase [Clostridia bacterium]
MGRIFAIMSGKGGVGKSTLATALAECYARREMNTVLLDGDVGLRCADLMLGMQDRVIYDLGDLAEKNCHTEQALVRHPTLPSLSLVAAPQMLNASDLKRKDIGRIITKLSDSTDVLIIDSPAGIGRGLKNLLGAAAEPVIVATPDDVCLRDAEKLSMLLTEREEPRPVVVFNRVKKKLVRLGEMRSPAQLAATLDMPLIGAVPDSPKIYRALLHHRGALNCGDHRVVKAIENIAGRLMGNDLPQERYKRSAFLTFFMEGDEA